jgi:hypothetical protein
MRFIKYIFLFTVLLACKKSKPPVDSLENNELKNGLLVLCEGLFQQNNASLSWLDFTEGTIENSFFSKKAGRLLGDTGNDLQRYGGKVYIVVNTSSTVEVLEAKTGASIKQIEMRSNGVAKQPRSVAFFGSNAFITCFDGYVDVLDTASLTITQRIPVGSNPEDLAVSNNKLYVSNSGGLNYPQVDSTVSVIDLVSMQEVKKITVGKNPGAVVSDQQGNIYVVSRGNYSSIPARMKRINIQTDEVETSYSFDALGISKMGAYFLINSHDYTTSASNIALFDPISETMMNPSLIGAGQFTTLYGVFYRPSDDRIYCLDAMGYTNTGYVKVFSSSGVFQSSYHVGLNPNSILFYE